MAIDPRKVRIIKIRPGLVTTLLREGHVCEAGRALMPIAVVPDDLTIVCSHFDFREGVIVLGAHSETFTPVPLGVAPPDMSIAFLRGSAPTPEASGENTSTRRPSMETGLNLKDRVLHAPTGLEGRVVAIHLSLIGNQAQIEHVDNEKRMTEHWLPIDELTVVAGATV